MFFSTNIPFVRSDPRVRFDFRSRNNHNTVVDVVNWSVYFLDGINNYLVNDRNHGDESIRRTDNFWKDRWLIPKTVN